MSFSGVITVLTHMIVFVVFVNRYFVGLFLKKVAGKNFDETVEGYEPTVSVVVPMFNEGSRIAKTVKSLATLEYPAEKYDVIIVDDCSTDDSYNQAKQAAQPFSNVHVIRNETNIGKRRGINRAVRTSTAEIIVSVDSDVVVDRDVIRQLVSRFVKPEIAAVGGRVNVINREENWLTRMQTIKYFFGYEYLKNLERAFNTVMCLSGCLTAYRRSVLIELEPILEDRNLLGVPIKYGEDRYLTRQIVKAGYQTTMTLGANAYTMVPSKLGNYFSQQLRWRRSNVVDFIGGVSHIWRVNPFVMIHYLGLFGMMFTYPVIIFHTVLTGQFLPLATIHIGALGVLATAYRIHALQMPKEQRVNPVWFLTMVIVMPVTYLLLTPLAIFTLDSGSWETRGAPKMEKMPAKVDEPKEKLAEVIHLARAQAAFFQDQDTKPMLDKASGYHKR